MIQVAEGKPHGAPELVKQDVGRSLPMGFTRNGSYFYGLQTNMQDVYVATLDPVTGQVLTPPTPISQRFVGSNTSPDWSPDGRYLAYISQRRPTPGDQGSGVLIIRSLETGDERILSPKLNSLQRLRWSPDGRYLIAPGRDNKGRQGLYRIDTQTGDVTPVALSGPGTYAYFAVWAPDSKAVFYWRTESASKSSVIIARNLETGEEKDLYRTTVGTTRRNLALSPDGQLLAFLRTDPPTSTEAVMVIPATGGEPKELARWKSPDFTSPASGLVWTPDGRHVLFTKPKQEAGKTEQINELWRVSVEGGEPERSGLAMEQLSFLRFHPDGRRIAFRSGRFSAEVWVMENFLPTLKAAK